MTPNSAAPQSNHTRLAALARNLGAPPVVAYNPAYALVAKDPKAGLLLGQCVYWSDKGQDGWFYKTYAEWEIELGLSKKEVMTAAGKLSGWLETKVQRVNGYGPPTVHYRVKIKELEAALKKLLKERAKVKAAASKSDSDQTSLSKLESDKRELSSQLDSDERALSESDQTSLLEALDSDQTSLSESDKRAQTLSEITYTDYSQTEITKQKEKKPAASASPSPPTSARSNGSTSPNPDTQRILRAYKSCLTTREQTAFEYQGTGYKRHGRDAARAASASVDAGEIGPAYRRLKAGWWKDKALPLGKVVDAILADASPAGAAGATSIGWEDVPCTCNTPEGTALDEHKPTCARRVAGEAQFREADRRYTGGRYADIIQS